LPTAVALSASLKTRNCQKHEKEIANIDSKLQKVSVLGLQVVASYHENHAAHASPYTA